MKSTRQNKPRSSSPRILVGSIAVLLSVLAATPAVRAVDVTWDITPGNVGVGNGTITGGPGAWDTANGNWTVDGGLNNIAWNNANDDTAVFGGTAGTVTLGTPITVGGLTFNNNAGYVLTSDTITFGVPGTVTANVSAQIDSSIDAAGNGLTFAGAGNLVTNTISNTTTLTKTGAGTLTLAANTFTPVTIDGGTITGGTLFLEGGTSALTSNATSAVNNDITLSLFASHITSTAGTLTLGGTLDANILGLTFAGSGDTVVTGAIINGLQITKAGTGTLTLSGLNTHTSFTNITAGTLKLGSAGDGTNTPLGVVSGSTIVSTGAALDVNGFTLSTSEALILNGTGMSNGGALTNSGGAATYSGLITLGSASSIVASSGNLTVSNLGTITGLGFGLTLGGAASGSSLDSIIGTGAGTVTKTGSGTWTLTAASTYTGATTIAAGTLKLGTAGSGANTPLGTTAAGTTVAATGAALDLNGFTLVTSEALTLNGTGISSGGALTNSGAAVTYSGLLTLGSASSIIASTGNVVLSHTGTITGSGFGLTLGGTAGASSLAGIIGTGTGTLTKTGIGTWALSRANTFSGDTLVSGGTLTLSNNQALQNSALDTTGGGLVTLTTTAPTFGGLKGSANLTSVITTGYGSVTALTLNPGTGASLTYSGIIPNGSGSTTFTKSGAGSQTLAGNLTYLGATTVNAGSLILSGNNTTATGDIAVNSSGVIQFNTTNSINGGAHNAANRDVTVNAGGTVAFGPAFGAGAADVALALANRIVAASAGTIAADNYAGAAFNFSTAGLTAASLGAVGTVNYVGTYTPNGTTYRLGGGGGTLNYGVAIAGAGNSLAVSGPGTVGLALANSYANGTTVSGGTLLLSAPATLGSTAGALAVSGGTLDLGATSQTVGAVTISGGTVQNGNLTGTSYSITGGTITASLTGAGVITATGNPTILNSNNSGFSGAINVTSNTLRAIDPRSLGSGIVTLSSGTTLNLVNDGSGTGLGNSKLETLNYVAAVTLGGNASVTVDRFTASGAGILFNAQNKTMRLGALNIGSQTLTVGNSNGFGLEFAGTTTLSAANPTFNVGGGSNAPVVQGLTLSGKVTGAFGLTKSGGGTLVLTNATNDFGSASTISVTGGLLSISSDAHLGAASNIVSLSGGGLQASGTFSTARRINTTGGSTIDVTQGNVLTLTTTAFNNGSASANGLTKNGNGIFNISVDNTAAYTGVFTINAGAVRVSNAGALGAAANHTVVANNVGAAVQINGVATNELFTINNTGINSGGAIENFAGTSAVNGAITLGTAATIGSTAGTLDISGTISGAFGLTFSGAGNINLNTALNANVAGLTKIGSGTATVAVDNAGNTNAITVNAGTFQVGSTTTGAGKTNGILTVNPSATLKLDNTFTGTGNRLSGKAVTLAGATLNFIGHASTPVTEALGSLTFGVGDSTVRSTYNGADSALSFTTNIARPAGATRNYVASGGVNGTTNQIVLGQAFGFIDQGSFFGGNAYAYMDADATFVRGGAYGSDAGFVTSGAAATLAAGTHQQITGAVSAQNTATFSTFNLSGNNNLTLAPGQSVTFNGLLKTGNVAGGATLSGGNGLRAASNAELVVRADGANDVLTINTPILAQGSNAFTKTGLGNVILSGGNTYTGQTTVNQGTLTLAGGNHTLPVGTALVVNTGGILALGTNSQYVSSLSSASSIQGAGGIITGTGGTLTVNQTTSATFAGSIQGSVNLVKTGNRTLTLTDENTTTGTISVIGGLGSVRERNNAGDLGFGLFLQDGGTIPNTTGITIRNSTLNIDNTGTKDLSDRVNDLAPITLDNGTIRFVGRVQSNSTETVGAVTASGFSAITMLVAGNANTQTGQASSTLTLTSLTRSSGGIIHFNRSGGVNTPLGRIGNNPRVLLVGDNTSGLTFSNDSIVGMYTNNDNDKMMPVSYVPGLGFGNMGQTGFPNHYMTGADGNGFTGPNTLENASPTNDFNTGATQRVKLGGQTINSLGIQGAGQGAGNTGAVPLTFQAPSDTLTIASGWLALWFRRNVLGDTTNRGAITSGQSELFLFGDFLGALGDDNFNTVNSVIKDSGANPVKFVMGLARNTSLTANNTYTGGTVVSNLVARENGGSGYFSGVQSTLFLDGTTPGSLTIPNATNPANGLVMNSSNVTMQGNSGQIGSGNIVTLNGQSILTLIGNNTLAGVAFNSNATNGLAGTVPAVNPGGSLTLTGDITSTPTNAAVTPIISSGSLNFAGVTRNITVAVLPESDYAGYSGLHISSVILNGSLTKNGAGMLTLSGANTYTGTTTINAGTLQVGAGGITGSLDLDNAIVNNGTLVFNRSNISTQQGAFGVISGPGAVIQAGTGTTVLGGANIYTGVTTVKAGVLRLDNTTALPGGILTAGGTSNLSFNGGVLGLGTDNSNFTRSLNTAATASAVTFVGAGGWAAFGANATVNLGGGGTIAWGTANTGFNGQTLILGAATADSEVDVQNAINLGTTNRTIQVDNGSADTDGRLTGAITGTGAGGLTKTGAGTLNLDNATQSYNALTATAGTTNVNGLLGTLPGLAVVAVNNNGTKLRLGSVSQTLSSLSIGAGATVIFTSGAASGSLVGGGGKTPDLGGSSAVVPEPGTIGLLLVGVLGALARRRRQE